MWNRYVGLRRSVVRTRTCFLKGGGWPRLGHPTIDPAAYLGITFAEFAGQVTALDGEDSRMRFEASGAGQSPSEILVRLVAEVGRDPRCVDGALTVEPKATISIRWAAPVDVPQTGIMCHELTPTPGRTSPLPFDVRCRARTAVGT